MTSTDTRTAGTRHPDHVERWLLAAIATPIVMATLAVVVFIGSEMLGRTPLSLWPENIAEAAGMGNAAETQRMMLDGQDPNTVEPVRPEIISSAITRVTTLEAAVFSRRLELIRMLERRGAIPGSETRRALACLAKDIEESEMAEYLAPNPQPACQPGAAREQVLSRSASVAAQ